MKQKTVLLLLITSFLTVHLATQAQENPYPDHTNCERQMYEAGHWYFGVFAGIDFTFGEAVPETWQPDVFQTPISSAVISDSAGNLLFLTNGKQIFNKSFNVMFDGLFGHYSCTQPAIIIPKPGENQRYYVITSDSYRNINGDKGLNYTEVDMSLNYGQGNVVSTNTNLVPDRVDGRLTAVKHANGVDYWLIAHRWESNEFLAYRITSGGINPLPVSSNAGSVHQGNDNMLGYMKASPDGSRLAVSLYGNSSIEVFNFNNSSGQVASAIVSPSDFQGAYGLEFSPDNSKLYLSTLDYANFIPAFPSKLYQFDLNSSDIFADPMLIQTSTNAFRYGGLQLGLDGRIYMAKSINASAHSNDLGVVYNPNRLDTLCNFNRLDGASGVAFDLGGKESYWGLPNVVQSFVDWPHFTYDSVCIGDISIFSVNNQANIDDASWDFNDPAGTSNTADFLNPTHMFSNEGQYQVSVTETYEVQDFTYNESVTIYPLPEVDFGVDTIYIFEGDYARLNVGDWAAYNWSTGETSSEILVGESGRYWVDVQNGQCCWNSDTVDVVLYDLYMPNAFRPESSINNEFKPVAPFNAVQDYRLQIFDRWGQMIFESRDLGVGWKGEINNEPAPLGVYAWRIDYETVNEEGTRPIVMSGTVMLLR